MRNAFLTGTILISALATEAALAGPCLVYPGFNASLPFVGSISQKLTDEHVKAFQREWSRQGLASTDPSLVSYHISDLRLSPNETATLARNLTEHGVEAFDFPADAARSVQEIAAIAKTQMEVRVICRKSGSWERWSDFTQGTENVSSDFHSPAFAEAMENFSRDSIKALSTPSNYLQALGNYVPFVDDQDPLPFHLNYSFSLAKRSEEGEVNIVDGPSFSIALGEIDLSKALALLSGEISVIELLDTLRKAGKLQLSAEQMEAFRTAYEELLQDPANARVIPKASLIADFGYLPLKLATAPITIQGNRPVPQFGQAELLPTVKADLELTPLEEIFEASRVGNALGEQRDLSSAETSVNSRVVPRELHDTSPSPADHGTSPKRSAILSF